jgi:hypothetical protein
MKRYKLLKDLPGFPAGTIFEYFDNDGSPSFEAVNEDIQDERNYTDFPPSVVERTPEWFEPVVEQWQPTHEELFWYVDSDGDLVQKNWFDSNTDRRKLDFGNCFRSREQAREARDRIKALVQQLHEIERRRQVERVSAE